MITFQEDLLHYVWKLRYYSNKQLFTTDGQELTVIHPGIHNFDAGPDFSEGKIKLSDTLWHGNIELHLRASDWIRHEHYNDEAYDNVILHVVYEADETILRNDGRPIPCLSLKGLIDTEIFERYHYLTANKQWIPCENLVTEVDEFQKQLWLERLFVARLEEKGQKIIELLHYSNQNWEYVLFIMLGRYFGSRVNTSAFEQLCRSIDLYTIYKNRHDSVLVEALMFGQSGLLSKNFNDLYPNHLRTEYQFLKKKYKLTPIEIKLWKFFRLRPSNFPTIRIAQFSALIAKNQSLFSRLLEIQDIQVLYDLFEVEINSYWDDHYIFDKASKSMSKKIGSSFKRVVIINAILPLIFMYGKLRKEEQYIDRAINLMQAIPAEQNKIIEKWKKLKFQAQNAADTQALIHLKNDFCDKNKCLQCAIGHQVLKEDYPVYGLMYS